MWAQQLSDLTGSLTTRIPSDALNMDWSRASRDTSKESSYNAFSIHAKNNPK